VNDRPDTPLYLASTSPRRAKLLREAGWVFEQIDPAFDDTGIDLGPVNPVRAAEALAYLKAAGTADTLDRGIVIGCDTIVTDGTRKIGKPRDAPHARAMLGSLIDASHQVVTAVALVDPVHHRLLFHDTATVRIGPVDADVLDAYLASGRWAGKAGGYNLAELADDWPFEVRGDPTTVIGLPMQRLADQLQRFCDQRADDAASST
jgi:septum formation protein